MRLTNRTHLIIVSIINLAVILSLINMAWEGNDKAILAVIFGYLALTLVNAVIWLILGILKKPAHRIYKLSTLCLIIFFVPALIASMFY